MDFFDTLRRGCVFGKARSKDIAFKKVAPQLEENEEQKKNQSSEKGRSPLDFFGYGAEKDPQNSGAEAASSISRPAKKRRKLNNGDGEGTAELAEEQKPKSERFLRDEVVHLRRQQRIHVSAGAPDPLPTFDAMAAVGGVPAWLVANLRGLGFTTPTPIQMQCFPAVMAGFHVLGSAPTGSGKTMAFLAPLLALMGKPGKEFARTVIVDPSRELAKQTLDEFEKLTKGKKWTGRLIDKLGGDKAKNIKRLDVAVATPLRLATMLREDQITLDAMQHLVLDEADKLLDLGFAPQIDEILSFCPNDRVKRLQTLMFSATLPPVVCELADSILTQPMRVSIGNVNAAAQEVDQKLLFITNEESKLFSLRQLVHEGKIKPPALIFVQSKDRAKDLFGELIYDGIFADAIHGDRTKQQRDNSVNAFRSGKTWMLICTDVLARGVDFKGVETVINYDFPATAATYIHRIGRTGRAGRSGKAITLFTLEDFESLRSIVGVMRESGCEVPEWMLRLKPQNKVRKRMAEWRPRVREKISTVSDWDLKKMDPQQQRIEHAKKKKREKKAANAAKAAAAAAK